MCSGPKIPPLVEATNKYLDTLNKWFNQRNLIISAPKSSATIFTTFSNELSLDLDVKINGTKVPTIKDPKILGCTLDPLLSFRKHTENLKAKVMKRNNIMKALSGTNWGLEKETLLTTYKATGRSLLNYGCPIWSPGLSETNWGELQVAQNNALRVATGCVKMTAVSHLHHETKVMPVKDHCHMLSKQFLLATTQQTHPNACNLDAQPPARQMRETLVSKFGKDVADFSVSNLDQKSAAEQVKLHTKSIHTSCVKQTLNSLSPNKVTKTKPPEINSEEKLLPRTTRSTLAQLRSGYSSSLNSFLSRCFPSKYSNTCPNCGQSPHDTAHLFKCPSKPTHLTLESLWDSPKDVATFLGLDAGDGPGLLDDND